MNLIQPRMTCGCLHAEPHGGRNNVRRVPNRAVAFLSSSLCTGKQCYTQIQVYIT